MNGEINFTPGPGTAATASGTPNSTVSDVKVTTNIVAPAKPAPVNPAAPPAAAVAKAPAIATAVKSQVTAMPSTRATVTKQPVDLTTVGVNLVRTLTDGGYRVTEFSLESGFDGVGVGGETTQQTNLRLTLRNPQ